ncbi:tRNA uridine-5-carboxymethylaminomethyl(34) synthesis GTPase MnmE [Roseibaca sp. Y0-43]|uniref:tRNA uridine-5-carboxymethylaminomethyl(34) synthesis GTPase MnmE n=1 Tax=Roseibaca sp. Y0-43 TaxID=2816854 RepID=UPI001D0CB6BB|nr:tRNA uridine-5-carboxymethylaminomethyl(34) synthesis GTPase MnmE [Roseibaca sp. Y0-43]MCC1480959.1 tRNA uridine-5-carboxymethylaminomethyl(34) synthesis GTPase MnmE [Roseibaca sp. Y0-43]
MDTIFALASARGKSGVAVIRISGPRAHAVARAMAGSLPPMREAGLRMLRDGAGERLDSALVLCFAQGASFTGEDVAELMVHGSLATVAAIERCLAQDHGLRMAQPGEFTRRALDNGQMDLTQVEALSDLLEAETESQRRQALRVLDGAIGKVVAQWRAHLIKAAALVETAIDFVEEDVGNFDDMILDELRAVQSGLRAELAGQRARERVQTGFEVALVGPVNAGKSSLLNALAGREAAITSDIAGTTRDVLEVRMDVGGYAVTFLDTAGLRDMAEQVEAIGIARGKARAEQADLRIILQPVNDISTGIEAGPQDIVVRSKADLGQGGDGGISVVTGQGLDWLLDEITSRLSAMTARDGVTIRQRHAQAMQQAEAALSDAIDKISQDDYIAELVAADIRTAMTALDSLIGVVDVEDVLGDIFSSFCIGK